MRTVDKFIELTGLSETDFLKLLKSTGWKTKEAFNNMDSCITGTVGSTYSREAIIEGIKNAGLYEKLADSLSRLNTMRGGENGFKGFVFEELHATNASVSGNATTVLNNNGIADLQIISAKGKISYAQVKAGYNGLKVDFTPYKGQTIVIDKGNQALISQAKKAGLKVIESDVPLEEAARLSKQMQLEGNIAEKITGKKNSVVVPKVKSTISIAKEAHNVGLKTAKTGAQFGGGFSIGSNVVEVISGDKEIDEALVDVAKDTAVSAGVGYATGVVATAVGNTAVGTAISTMAGTAATAVSSTAVGGTVVAAGTTAAGAIGGLGTAAVTSTLAAGSAASGAVATAATAVGSAVAGTSVGGAVVAAGTAAGSAIAGTAVGSAAIAAGTAATGAAVAAGTAVAAAAVAAAPVVAVGAVLGGAWCLGKKLFGR